MILARMPRPLALVVLFLGFSILAILLTPLALVPMVLMESTSEYVRFVERYYGDLIRGEAFGSVSQEPLTALLIAVALWSLLAVAFLAPITGKVRTTTVTRSLLPSVISAVILGALLCGTVAAALVELVLALETTDTQEFESALSGSYPLMTALMLGGWVVGGTACALCLRHLGKSRDPNNLERVLRVIFAGSVIELALGLPIYLIVRRRTNCECALASFGSIVLGVAALLWVCGPAIVLLYTRKSRRGWLRAACPNCGYPRRTDATTCSECGTALAGPRCTPS